MEIKILKNEDYVIHLPLGCTNLTLANNANGTITLTKEEDLEKQVEELEELNKALEEKVNDLALQDFIEKTLGGYSHEYLRRHAQQLQAKALAGKE